MPDASSQPEYHPDISEFIEWVQAHSIQGTLGPGSLVNHPFMPRPRLETYLKENGRTKTLLRALFPGRDPPIASEEIWRHCIRVFAILLLIGKGTFIQHFLQHDQLWDSKLPFISDRCFPLTTGSDYFFESFCKKQWHFCPYTFRRNVIDARLEKECILPIVSKELLGDGGSASTYKIKLHPAYDDLSTSTVNGDPSCQYAKTYVLKTYRFKDAKDNYESEVRAFRALRAGGSLGKSIIGFYGSYEQDESYNVLLEYADRGTLEDYLATTPPPSTAEDIYTFWRSLFNVIKALKLIHNVSGDNPDDPPILQGWHQDIKPTNILVTSGKSTSIYDCEVKIADLGLSHFRKLQAAHGAATDKDTSGTREYGAPECYRFADFMERSQINVKQAVDIWSLGCVFSEVAVWVVHDKDRLEAYRQMRQDETKQVFEFKDGRAFHDGEKVLQSVGIIHKEVLQNIRRSDHVTRSVVEKMITEMLDEVDGRPNTQQLWRKSHHILIDAQTKLKSAKGENQIVDPESRRQTPPIVPPDLPHSQSDQTGRNRIPELWSSLKRTRDMRAATFDVPARVHTPSVESNADNAYETHDEMLDNTPTARSRPQDLRAATHNHPPSSFGDADHYQFAQKVHDKSVEGSVWKHSPTRNGKIRELTPTKHSDSALNPLQDSDVTGSMSGLDIQGSNESSRCLQTEVSPRPQVDLDGLQGRPISKTATIAASSPPTRQSTSQPLPYLSLANAENWMLKRRERKTSSVLEHAYLLDNLNNRDHVFLVDDAASMRPYWGDVCNVLRVLAYMVKGSDDDGMDLYFTISSIKHNSKKATGLHNQIRGKQLQGTSDIGLRLSIILDDYKASLRQPTPKRLSFLGRAKRRVRKGLSVYILTDAVWQPHSDAGQPIESLVRTLVELDSPQKQVGIQFIRFGNDPESIEKLRHLDSGLHLERDIVDAEPAEGNVWKMLLGPSNKWFDGDKEEDHGATTHGATTHGH